MRIQQYIVSILFVMTFTGCTKEFDLDPGATKPLYVIEGRISNMWGPYYVRITKSTGLVANPDPSLPYRDSAEAVTNALVIITDDTGIKDTLIPCPPTIDRYVYYFRDSVDYRDLTIDSVFTTVGDRATTQERGYYQTTKIKGQPGHTYYLEVHIGDTLFRSSAYMPPAPALEHVELRDTTLRPYLNSGLVPVAYFKDPPAEKNYYGLNYTYTIHAYRYDYSMGPGMHSNLTFSVYPFYVFDDKLLIADLNAMPVRIYPNNVQFSNLPEGYYPYWNSNWNIPYSVLNRFPKQIRLHAFTKETYDYFNVLYKQLENNGNIYKPTPASARGNISGGALGLFFATGISDKLLYQ